MDIESPDDCYVSTLTELHMVKKGDLLAELYSPELSKALSRMDAYSASVSIAARKFEDGRRSEVRALQEQVLGRLEEQLQGLNEIHQKNLDLFHMGNIDHTVVDQSLVRVSATAMMLDKQRLLLNQFDRETQDLVDGITNLKSHIASEIQRANDLHVRLSIKSPCDGTFTPNCEIGLFLKKGRLIGTLEAV